MLRLAQWEAIRVSEMLGGGRSGASDLDIGHHTPEFPGHLARRPLRRRASAIAPLFLGPGDYSERMGPEPLHRLAGIKSTP